MLEPGNCETRPISTVAFRTRCCAAAPVEAAAVRARAVAAGRSCALHATKTMRQATMAWFPAVLLAERTAWLILIISTALRLQLGPLSAAPIAHIHVDNDCTPGALTSRFICDAEPPASGGANMSCAAELQPLGSGLHSVRPFGVPKHGDFNHNGSGVGIGTQRCWCIRLCTGAAGDLNCFARCVSLLVGCTCIPTTQWIVHLGVSTIESGRNRVGSGTATCTSRHSRDAFLCESTLNCNNSVGFDSTYSGWSGYTSNTECIHCATAPSGYCHKSGYMLSNTSTLPERHEGVLDVNATSTYRCPSSMASILSISTGLWLPYLSAMCGALASSMVAVATFASMTKHPQAFALLATVPPANAVDMGMSIQVHVSLELVAPLQLSLLAAVLLLACFLVTRLLPESAVWSPLRRGGHVPQPLLPVQGCLVASSLSPPPSPPSHKDPRLGVQMIRSLDTSYGQDDFKVWEQHFRARLTSESVLDVALLQRQGSDSEQQRIAALLDTMLCNTLAKALRRACPEGTTRYHVLRDHFLGISCQRTGQFDPSLIGDDDRLLTNRALLQGVDLSATTGIVKAICPRRICSLLHQSLLHRWSDKGLTLSDGHVVAGAWKYGFDYTVNGNADPEAQRKHVISLRGELLEQAISQASSPACEDQSSGWRTRSEVYPAQRAK